MMGEGWGGGVNVMVISYDSCFVQWGVRKLYQSHDVKRLCYFFFIPFFQFFETCVVTSLQWQELDVSPISPTTSTCPRCLSFCQHNQPHLLHLCPGFSLHCNDLMCCTCVLPLCIYTWASAKLPVLPFCPSQPVELLSSVVFCRLLLSSFVFCWCVSSVWCFCFDFVLFFPSEMRLKSFVALGVCGKLIFFFFNYYTTHRTGENTLMRKMVIKYSDAQEKIQAVDLNGKHRVTQTGGCLKL